MNKKALLVIVPIFFLSGMILGIHFFYPDERVEKEQLQTAFAFPIKKALSDFTFQDHKGKEFTGKDLKKKWSLLFFGFTHCPDICPTTLSTLNTAYKDLPSDIQKQLQVVLVSVDPERDSVSKLAEYIQFFNQDFVALATHQRDLIKLTQSLGVSFIKRPLKGGSDYTIDHSSRLFLIDPDGRRAAMFTPEQGVGLSGFSVEEVRQDLVALMTENASNAVATRQ